ncbi:DNA-processing protein DprA [Limnohabitans sp.]|jgi:predicted Rossmann fold nucleotide-binding protein DprA/Smf involved in DNA uptake|uniref:DNA-processing protein DprA n=1 Tax=Limnohabitans sp. TaxID=1907725 RepID=UPI0037C0B109
MKSWQFTRQEKIWMGLGNQALLDAPLTAFFSSRQCPGVAIRAAMSWALEQAQQRQPVVSGFHSLLEQSVLKVLLQARCPVVVVLARPVAGARLPTEWAEPLAQDRMAVVSAAASSGRLTEELAAQRNEWVAALASQIVVAHASPGGRLAALCDGWGYKGQRIRWLG